MMLNLSVERDIRSRRILLSRKKHPSGESNIETRPPQVADEQLPAVLIKDLTKFYGTFRALNAIKLTVPRGHVFGFLGPNGAGKTTTIRCLLDLIRPTEGMIRVLGIDPRKDPVSVRRAVGYLSGELNVDDRLTAEQLLRLFDAFRGGGTDWTYVRSLTERLELPIHTPVKNFSKGNKQKVGVIQAFMSQPELLLLDEPTSGLDPLNQRHVLGFVKEAKERGATVFFSSHNLNEVQEVCEQVAVVRNGEIVEVATTESLIRRSFTLAVIEFETEIDRSLLIDIPGVSVLEWVSANSVRVRIDGSMARLFNTLSGVAIRNFETMRPSLEEIFLHYYSDSGDGSS